MSLDGIPPGKLVQDGVNAGAAVPSARAIYEQRKLYGKKSVNEDEISQYNVEHLTTFAVERKDGLLTVDDGVRKLRILDARGRIWLQEALMQVDDKAVKLFDQTSHEELEHFSMVQIQHVQTVIDDPYSMLVLMVNNPDQKTPDMYFFNCPNVPPDVIGSDIESAMADCKDKKGRKIRPETLRRTRERVEATVIPPPPLNPPPAPPMRAEEDSSHTWNSIVQSDVQTFPNLEYGDAGETTEMLSARINRDVQILNHTLDDIEDFVSKLQKSEAAKTELNRRKNNKKPNKAKRKMAGDGMLTLRSRLPPHEKFNDCYRKFKLAFTLLAKLKDHIQNPNAIEIVHFLFSPLQMCIRSCGGFDIPRSIESPLLSRDAIDLLHNCLTTSEVEIWKNLGDFWTKSRSEFPTEHYFAPYYPIFRSGWEPPLLRRSSSNNEHTNELAASIEKQANRVSQAEVARRQSDPEAFKHHVEQHVTRNQIVNHTPILNHHLNQKKAKMCRAMYAFVGRNKNELSVGQDELLEVINDEKTWWRVVNSQGMSGFVPSNQMVLISNKSPSSSSDSASGLSLSPVTPNPPPAPIPPPPPPPLPMTAPKIVPVAPIKRDNKKQYSNMNGNNNNGPKSTEPIYSQSTKHRGLTGIDPNKLKAELNERVIQKKGQKNFWIPMKKSGGRGLRVTEDSTKDEVKRWLESIGFSSLTIDSLGVLTGAQIFTLKKEELKMVCEEEGARVYSQLQVQKSMVKDRKEDENELSAILKFQKKKAEQPTTDAGVTDA